ncbi:hypothetical protein ACQCVH_11255 [Bacillus infantis]|uniref:hypothetical protein n=1 Tax=Bacillus infantis TaxID=324767 RepID=UPI003CEBCFB6
MGKQIFVRMYSLAISIPLVLDYYIIKFLLDSFRLVLHSLIWMVWAVCLLLGAALAIYVWNRMERDWVKDPPII